MAPTTHSMRVGNFAQDLYKKGRISSENIASVSSAVDQENIYKRTVK